MGQTGAENVAMAGSGTLSMELDTATLGDLLIQQRTATDTTVAGLSEATGLTMEQITAVESGRHDLTPAELRRLLAAYDLKRPFGRFCRPVIEMSLEGGWVTMRPTRQIWTTPANADENLVCYLSLLHRSHGVAFGTRVPLKSIDLSILRSALAIRRDDVDAELGRRGLSLTKPMQEHRGLLIVTASGAALAAGAMLLNPATGADYRQVTLGQTTVSPSIEIVVSDTVQAATSRTADAGIELAVDPGTAVDIGPAVDIGTALKVERDPKIALTESSDAPAVEPIQDGRDIEIGTPIIIDRSADRADGPQQRPSARTSRGPPTAKPPVSKGRN